MCFYISFCTNAVGCQCRHNNQHIHVHSLAYASAGLTENQHPMDHFQVQLYLIWFLWSSQHRENSVRPTKPPKTVRLRAPKPQKKHIDRSSCVMVANYQKLCCNFKRIFSSNKVTSMLRTGCATKSETIFLAGHGHFATLMRPNSITLPRRRLMVAPSQCFKSSKVDSLPFVRHHHHISAQL